MSRPVFYLLDDLELTLEELLDANPGVFEPEEIEAMRALKTGESVTLGGGAAAEFTLKRIT